MKSRSTVAPSDRPIWIDGPWTDLLIGCGGWSLPLLLVSYTLVERDVPRWSAVFYALALVCNYPHYMATIYRAYGSGDLGAHRLYTHYLTAGLLLLGVVAHINLALVPWLFTAYVMWSPWHYTGQNFGLLVMFLRRADVNVTPAERRALRVAFVASFVMLLAAFNLGASRDPLVLSLGLPGGLAVGIEVIAAFTFFVGGAVALVPIVRRSGRRAVIAPLTLYATQALWFVVPIVIGWMSSLSAPQTRYSSGMLAVMHSAQYLWITRYFARRDAEQRDRVRRWSDWAYWSTLVIGGIALFLPIPWMASYGWQADFTTSVFIVAAIVNLHHFMIDGVVWKLRNVRVGQVLEGRPMPTHGVGLSVTPEATPHNGRHTVLVVARWAAVAVLLVLAAVDQWRYGLVIGQDSRQALESAARLNPYDSGAHYRLAQAARRDGDIVGSEAALRQAIAANPHNPSPRRALIQLLIESGRLQHAYAQAQDLLASSPRDVETLINAGVLAYRLDDMAAAEKYWRLALAQEPSLREVHLYLAERLDARGALAEAVPHYRRYLELTAGSEPAGRPPVREVAQVVVKFADVLARQGDRAAAQSQYDLAIGIARQHGLSDVEQMAQERRARKEAP